jgi:hypothetical protein
MRIHWGFAAFLRQKPAQFSRLTFGNSLISKELIMAEREGFEPSLEFPLNTLSKRAPSTTRPSLRSG